MITKPAESEAAMECPFDCEAASDCLGLEAMTKSERLFYKAADKAVQMLYDIDAGRVELAELKNAKGEIHKILLDGMNAFRERIQD